MGAGNQGGSSSAEDGEIRKAFSADPNATAKDARDYFRDRDSGKLAARSYLDSRPTDRTYSDTGAPMDDTFAENIDSRLGKIGVTRNDTSFVNADGESVGSINSAGNFSGNRDVIAALKGLPSLSDMRQAASRETKYGPGSRAAQEGDINTSLLDFVDFAEDGTVQGMGPNRFMDERGRGQLVYDPSAVIPGLPAFTDSGEFNPQYDPSREGMVGQALQGVTNYIGDGGMLGAVTRGLGSISKRMSGGVAEDLNPGNFSPMRPVLRPTDGSTTENTGITSDGITSDGITSALMRGAGAVNKLTSDQLRDLPNYAGGYTGSGADNPFLSADRRGVSNQFNAQGVQVPFDGGNRIDVPLGIGTLPTSEERLLEAQKDRFKSYDDLSMDRLKTMQLRNKLIDASDPSFYDAFGNEYNNAETARTSDLINEADSKAAMQRQMQINSLGQRVPITDKPFYDLSASEAASLDDANLGYLQDRYVPEIVTQENINPVTAGFSGFNMDSPEVSSFRPTFDIENQQRANREASFGGADQGVLPQSVAPYGGQEFPLLDRGRPSFPAPETSSVAPYGGQEFNELERLTDNARSKRLGKLGTATGAENNMPLEDPREYIDPGEMIYDDADQLEDLMTTGPIDPSGVNVGGGFTDGGGGGGGGFGGCPEGYEPMTLENGETVCVPIEEEVTEEEVEEVTPVTPTVRPTMGPSAYTPQAVSPIRPYTLQPGEQGVGSLADILQLQNYPNIV